MKHSERIPVVALCGFLGSGKTTLLRRWSRDESLQDSAMIVHDLSDFGLDAELLSSEDSPPVQGSMTGRVAALHGIHAREELHASLGTTLKQMEKLDPTPSLVLCESTGAAKPWPLIDALTQNKKFFLRHFIVTVDALNLHRDFADGKVLTGGATVPLDPALKCAAEVLAEQIAFASIIILTKVDTITKESVDAQVKNLQVLQPKAAIGLSAQAGLMLNQLDATPAPKMMQLRDRAQKLRLLNQASTAEAVDSIILRDPRPFHPERLHQVCLNKLGTGLFRTKGFLWLASRPGDVLLWQQSGSQIALELTGSWRAEVAKNNECNLLPEELDHLRAKLEEQHPIFGDRCNELTLIGLQPARQGFLEALKEALCTDEEIEAWQKGEAFEEPWPSSLNRIE